MCQSLVNHNIEGMELLITPRELKAALPPSEAARRTVVAGRREIRDILAGTDRRLLVLVGPCSIHDPDAAREYARRLVALRKEYGDKLCIVMRVYFEKPRTTIGWKGLINDPYLDGSFRIEEGLQIARKLLLDINGLGLPCGTEVLDPLVPQYIDDLIAWGAIGARTTESQTHRQMASGLSFPVGFKNATDGDLQIAIDAMTSACHPHHFLGVDDDGRTCIVRTRGKTVGHIILRGGTGKPNFHPENIADAAERLADAGLDPKLVVDCSHANSNRKHKEQEVVWRSVVEQRANDGGVLIGAMLESNLEPGKQAIPDDLSQLEHGVSVTDECIGWDKTEELLAYAHTALPDPVAL